MTQKMKKLIILFGVFVTYASTYAFVYSQLLDQHDIDFQQFDNSQGVAGIITRE